MSWERRASFGTAFRWATLAAVPAVFAVVTLVFWTRPHVAAHRTVGAVVGVGAICFAVWVARRIALLEARLERRSIMLAESQRLARIGSFRWDQRTGVNDWTDEMFRVHGLEHKPSGPGPEYELIVHPDDREVLHTGVQGARDTLRPYEQEYRIDTATGQRWIHTFAEPILDNDGRFIGLQGTCQDITERKRAEVAGKASEERSRALIESAPNAVVVIDGDGSIVLVNDEATRLFDYPQDELIGRSVDMLLPGEQRLKHAALRAGYASEPKRRQMGSGIELWAQRKDSTRVSVDIALSPVETEDGPLVIAVVQDITERRLGEESMREAYERERAAADNLRALDETKTVFLEAVSHELRTPLTVIVGISSLLQDGGLLRTDDAFPELIASLDTSARRLEHLLDDLLDLDRLGRGIVKPHRRPTPVAEIAARIVGGMDIGHHPVHVDAHEVVADIDPAQTERIIENLVANALKHTPPETPVWVRAESADDGVVIVVEDAGPGVPENIRETVFAPFVKDTRGHVPGTGIGLSLVLRFAALHGGRAWVSTRRGGGASFHVYLPSTENTEGERADEVA